MVALSAAKDTVIQIEEAGMRQTMRWWMCAVLLGMALLMIRQTQAQPPGMEQRKAEAVWVLSEECHMVQTVVTVTQVQTVPSPYYPDGWVRTAWVSVLETNPCTQTQLLNAAGQLQTQSGLEIYRKLESATFSGTVPVWDGVTQSEGTVSVAVDWTGTGQVSRQVWRTLSRTASAQLNLSGLGLTLNQTTQDAQLSITK
jgi:hypothetical protein